VRDPGVSIKKQGKSNQHQKLNAKLTTPLVFEPEGALANAVVIPPGDKPPFHWIRAVVDLPMDLREQ